MVYFIKVAPCSKNELIQAWSCATNKIGKSRVRPSPGGPSPCKTTSKTKPTVGVLRTELVTVSGSQEQDNCATKREPCHSGEPSRMGWSDLWVKVNGALASTSWEVTWQGVKDNSTLACTILRVSWLVSESRECFGKHALERWLDREWKSPMHLQACSWEVRWLLSESQKCTCKHILKVSWLVSGRAAVLLVDTSKATQEQALQVCAWNIQKQQ